MSISADQRYYLKQKALYYFYEKGYSNTDIAKMLGISRVTLNRLLTEAREEGMVRIEIVDTKNLKYVLELEDRLKTKYGLKYVRLVDVSSEDPDTLVTRLAAEGAKHIERFLRSGMKIGLGWGKTLTTMIGLLSPNPAISGLEVYTLMGGACSEANFQPNLLAQSLLNLYSGSAYIINAPFLCHSDLLCTEIKKEPSIKRILGMTRSLDIALVGIGREPGWDYLKQSYYHFSDSDTQEIMTAGAVGDICGNFFDKDGNLLKTSVTGRIVSIDVNDLKSCKDVVAVAGGEHKVASILGAMRGGFIDALITDIATANKLLAEVES